MTNKVKTIITTWDDEPIEKIDLLRKTAVDIVTSAKPIHPGGRGRVNYPSTTLIRGFKRAKELGFSHAMRFRADNYCPTIDTFIDIFHRESSEKLVGLCWFHHINPESQHGYIMEHVIFGPIDRQLQYRTPIQPIGDLRFPEAFLQDSYFKKTQVCIDDTKDDFTFVLGKLVQAKQELYYTHHCTEQGNCITLWNSLGKKCEY